MVQFPPYTTFPCTRTPTKSSSTWSLRCRVGPTQKWRYTTKNPTPTPNFALSRPKFTDHHERDPQPDQAGREKGQDPFRGQLLPAPRVHLELRRPPADLGESRAPGRRHRRQGRQRPHRRARDRVQGRQTGGDTASQDSRHDRAY